MIDYPQVYEGSLPYVFISYAHKDTDIVLPLIRSLIEKGYRVWYDRGINSGDKFVKVIANHIDNSACMIVFLSENACESEFCCDEIIYAKNKLRKDKSFKMLVAYLNEDFTVPNDIDFALVQAHAIFRNRYENDESFLSELMKSDILRKCKSLMEEVDPAEVYMRSGDLYMESHRNYAREAFRMAIDIYRQLPEMQFTVFRPNLASAYAKLGKLYWKEHNRREDAILHFGKALEIYEGLVREDPAVYTHHHADVLFCMGCVYRDGGQWKKAEKCMQIALEEYEQSAKNESADYLSDLARVCRCFGNLYYEAKRFDRAEEFYKRAVDTYDCLAQTEPDTYEAELADACLDMGLLYVQLERFDEAMQMCDQSLNLKEHLAKKNPEVYEPILGHDLWHLGSVCERMYDPKRMRELFERALSIYERLNEKHDGRYSSCINYFRSVLNHRD